MNTYASRVAGNAALALFTIACGCAFAQRPSDPALLVPQAAAQLDYVAVANPLIIPAGMVTGAPSSVAVDKGGHLWVLYRGAQAFAEFDADGKFIRAFGEGLFTRSHGLKFDSSGNMWATDDRGHVVYKVSPQGQILLTLGTRGQAGQINQPTDVAVGANGDVFVAQGHTPGPNGNPRVVKNERLADPYTLRDFPPDIVWVYERMRRGEEKRPPVRPGWVVYLDRKRIATFYGTKNWEEGHFPEIKWLVSEHLGK